MHAKQLIGDVGGKAITPQLQSSFPATISIVLQCPRGQEKSSSISIKIREHVIAVPCDLENHQDDILSIKGPLPKPETSQAAKLLCCFVALDVFLSITVTGW